MLFSCFSRFYSNADAVVESNVIFRPENNEMYKILKNIYVYHFPG